MSLRWWRQMIAFYLVLMILCFPLWYLLSTFMNLPDEITFEQLIAFEKVGALVVIIILIGLWWTNQKRISVEDQVREKARVDERGFFLILRSFHQTEPHETSGGSLDMEGRLPAPAKSLLPLLGKAIIEIGVPILIGEPKLDNTSETWPGITIRTTDQNWREAFNYLAHACRAILLIPADTPGSLEEMETIQHTNLCHKTIIFMPPPIYYHGLSRYQTGAYEDQGWFGAFKDIDKKVLLEKEIAWNNLRDRLSIKGIQLPPFEPNGYLYLPNRDLSVRHKSFITDSDDDSKEKDEVLVGQLYHAFEALLAIEELPGVPVKDIFETLEEIEELLDVDE